LDYSSNKVIIYSRAIKKWVANDISFKKQSTPRSNVSIAMTKSKAIMLDSGIWCSTPANSHGLSLEV